MYSRHVAPFTGAWIETNMLTTGSQCRNGVAPFTGAWIETDEQVPDEGITAESHPLRVRELKQFATQNRSRFRVVAPFTGAWIETLYLLVEVFGFVRRTLYGCVNWNDPEKPYAHA